MPQRRAVCRSITLLLVFLACLALPLLTYYLHQRWSERCAVCERLTRHFHAAVVGREAAAEQLVRSLCTAFHIEKPDVCAGVTSEYGPVVVTVLANRLLDPYHICTEVLQVCPPGGSGAVPHLVPIPCSAYNHTQIFAAQHGLPPPPLPPQRPGLWAAWKWVRRRVQHWQQQAGALWRGVLHRWQERHTAAPWHPRQAPPPATEGRGPSAGPRPPGTGQGWSEAWVRALLAWLRMPWWEGGTTAAAGPAPAVAAPLTPGGYFAQLTDVHLDLDYQVGAESACGRPLCCRREDGPAASPSTAAPLFGDYKCDAPPALLRALLRFLATRGTMPRLDFLVFTGDIPPHNVWEVSQNTTVAAFGAFDALLQEALPGVPFYPVLGNHAAVPVDAFPGPPVNEWLMNATWQSWRRWLPASQEATVQRGGYYTVLHGPGVRVVGLNTQYCDVLNWWLLQPDADMDPAGQLAWLLQVLTKAEAAGEKVIILGHIPPGDSSCYSSYAAKYALVVDRFQNTIAAQLFGHTHSDHFHLFKDAATATEPVGVALVAPSVTPFTNRNPSFRVFEYSHPTPGSPFHLTNYHQYMLNLGEANHAGQASQWALEYSALEAYSLPSLAPASWAALVGRLQKDPAAFAAWAARREVQRPWECTPACHMATLCHLQCSTFDAYMECAGRKNMSWDDFLKAILNRLSEC